MNKGKKKTPQTYIPYPSVGGKNFYFIFDDEIVEETGMKKAIEDIAEILSEYGAGSRVGKGYALAKKKGKEKHAKKLKTKINGHRKRGLSKLKKVKARLKKVSKDLKKKYPSKQMSKDVDISVIREKLLNVDFTDDEKQVIQDEFDSVNDILKKPETGTIMEYLIEKIEHLEKASKDDETGFIPRSLGLIIAFCLGVAVGVIVTLVVVVVAVVTNVIEEIVDTVVDVVDEVTEPIDDAINCVFMANPNTNEVHNCSERTITCYLSLIQEPIYLETEEEALDYIYNRGYNGCAWCYSDYDTG